VGLFQILVDYCNLLDYSRLSIYLSGFLHASEVIPRHNPKISKFQRGTDVGRLSVKVEPAGKLRVFAMVDIWTQSILSPLHDSLFNLLSQLPNDGTFDQAASVKRCHLKAKVAGKSFSYDLSAATDRLPVEIQEYVLAALYGTEVARLWRRILTERDYYAYFDEHNNSLPVGIPYRYAVGQPMGALSS